MPVQRRREGATPMEATGVRGNVGLLALGLCVGILVGLALAPHGRDDAVRFVTRCVQDAGSILGFVGRPLEELPEDLSA